MSDPFAPARHEMVEWQLRRRGIRDDLAHFSKAHTPRLPLPRAVLHRQIFGACPNDQSSPPLMDREVPVSRGVSLFCMM
jgi:hypothetical protein